MFKTKEKAIIIDDKGELLTIETIGKATNTFRVKIGKSNKRFVHNKKIDQFLKIPSFLGIKNKYYFYNVNNPNALDLKNFDFPLFNTEDFDSIIETKVLKDLNKPNENSFLGNIEFKHILLGLGVLAIIIYFATGGTLS